MRTSSSRITTSWTLKSSKTAGHLPAREPDRREESETKKRADGSEGGITLDHAVAVLAAHLGVIDEEQIDNMSYVFFDDVMAELGHRLNYEAVVNYAGNAFCEKSWNMITKRNPFHLAGDKGSSTSGFAGFFSGSKITILQRDGGTGSRLM